MAIGEAVSLSLGAFAIVGVTEAFNILLTPSQRRQIISGLQKQALYIRGNMDNRTPLECDLSKFASLTSRLLLNL